nr:hypothetical protein [Tanacetum cinerariifolium]
NLFPPLDNPELTIRRRSRVGPTLLNDFEMATEGNGDPPVPELRTMKELCQPSLNGRGGPIAPIAIQETNFGLKNDMIQQSIKVNGVTDDALRLYLFPHSLTQHATAWFDRLPRNSINTFEQMAKMFHGKYFSPSMVTKLINEITNFRQRPDESLFEAWERGTFMKRRPKECYDLIENMTAHHNDWDTSAQRNALILMPKFGLTIKTLLTNKEKLFELARTSLNEHCSAVLLKKLPEKLGDPGKFLIPCDFPVMDECIALADLGASINLMPLSVWNKLYLPELTPTLITLELTDRSISRPIGVAEDVFVKVGKFHFPADFVVVDFDADPRVPLILGISFLKTEKALIDVFEGELTLRVGKEAIAFNIDQILRYSANYNDMTAKRIDVIDMACKEYIARSSCDFLLKEVDAFLAFEDDATSPKVDQYYYDSKGDILLFETFLNDDPSLPPPNYRNYLPQVRKELKICEAKNEKSSIDEPPKVELKDLPPHLEYVFLEGDDKLPIIIAKDLSDEEKTVLVKVLKSHKRAIAWKLFDIKGIDPEFYTHKILMEDDFKPVVQHQRRVNLKIHDVIKKESEDTNICLNWEKIHFMVNEGIVLGHKISKNKIEVDKAKVNVIAKLPHPTTVKGICSFLGHAGFYRRFIKEFSKIAWPMTRILEKDTPFFFSKECVESFQTLKKKLTKAPILIAPDWDLPFELMCDASDFAIGVVLEQCKEKHFRPIHYASKTITEVESNYTTTKKMLAVVYAFDKFRSYLIMNKSIVYTDHSALKYFFAKKDSKVRFLRWVLLLQEYKFKVIDTKRAENLAADHLSRLENPHQNVFDPKEINETFPLETLNMVSFRGNSSTPWFADFANYHARNFVVKGGVFTARKPLTFSRLAIMDPPRDIMARTILSKKCLTPDSIGLLSTVMPTTWSNLMTLVNVKERFRNEMKCLKIPSKFVRFFTFEASIS